MSNINGFHQHIVELGSCNVKVSAVPADAPAGTLVDGVPSFRGMIICCETGINAGYWEGKQSGTNIKFVRHAHFNKVENFRNSATHVQVEKGTRKGVYVTNKLDDLEGFTNLVFTKLDSTLLDIKLAGAELVGIAPDRRLKLTLSSGSTFEVALNEFLSDSDTTNVTLALNVATNVLSLTDSAGDIVTVDLSALISSTVVVQQIETQIATQVKDRAMMYDHRTDEGDSEGQTKILRDDILDKTEYYVAKLAHSGTSPALTSVADYKLMKRVHHGTGVEKEEQFIPHEYHEKTIHEKEGVHKNQVAPTAEAGVVKHYAHADRIKAIRPDGTVEMMYTDPEILDKGHQAAHRVLSTSIQYRPADREDVPHGSRVVQADAIKIYVHERATSAAISENPPLAEADSVLGQWKIVESYDKALVEPIEWHRPMKAVKVFSVEEGIDEKEIAPPPTPPLGRIVEWADPRKRPYAKDSSGIEYTMMREEEREFMEAKWADKPAVQGDIAVFDGTSYKRLPVGANNKVLTANSAVAEGVEWKDVPAGGGATIQENFAVATRKDTDQSDSGLILGATPTQEVQIDIDGIPLKFGFDRLNSDCYASADFGGTSRANFASIAATDKLFFNPTKFGYPVETNMDIRLAVS